MPTTLHLDDDVYFTARALAKATGVPIGSVVSDVARRGLREAALPAEAAKPAQFPTFPVRGRMIATNEMVADALADN